MHPIRREQEGTYCITYLPGIVRVFHIVFINALVLSIVSFHEYGLLPADIAVIGLIVEINFIVTFTQRFFGK